MTWNHRVVRRVYDLPGSVTTHYEIREVYYDDDKPNACTEDPVGVCGESVNEIRETLERMAHALDKPVLEYDDFITGNRLAEGV